MCLLRYKVELQASEEGYSASVPELPGCHSQGATREEVLTNIDDAVRDYLDAAPELPQIGKLCVLITQEDNEGIAAFQQDEGEPLLDSEVVVRDLRVPGNLAWFV